MLLIGSVFIFTTGSHPVDFNSEVKPIFNKKCIACHGGVKRKAGFSLLFRSEALEKNESGIPAIIPGDPDNSEMIRRITHKDPEERMPYKHEPLTEHEISVLRNWIKQGANWGNHWAYVEVKKPELPKSGTSLLGWGSSPKSSWAKSDLDVFIADKLTGAGLKPSPEAEKSTLLRRVSLDLTGLPPTLAVAQRFLANNDANAYEELVDSLLASPRFGERWTAMWLDLARYADTKGYEKDENRNIWKYRDWLIQAFNEDKPYDRFLIEQMAGDLLPNPSDAQLIATAFHRNSMTNDEGGTDNEEFRTAAVMDRVNTTWQALLGTTFSCVQCHSHPYDPFSHDEYYKFMAFFNNTRDEDTFADYPVLRDFSSEDSAALLRLNDWLNKNGFEKRVKEINQFVKTWQPSINSLQADQFLNSELADTKWLTFRNHAVARLKNVNLDNRDQVIFRFSGYLDGGLLDIHLDSASGPVLTSIKIPKTKGWQISSANFPRSSGTHNLFFTYRNPGLKKPDDSGLQFDWLHFTEQFPGKDRADYAAMNDLFWQLLRAEKPGIPVMQDNPPEMYRTTKVFERGNWLVTGKEVEPGVPNSLNPMPAQAPRNRIGLAMWLTSKQNPLTARTMVNRLWEQLFGNGLVETLEDLGTQGALPTHQELLDFLSYRFMNDFNWSTKKLLKEMVMSATYRQDSRASKIQLDKDPENKLYGRGVRVRLSAEQVRDQALWVSGLLSEKMYGPPVMPWQPAGIWLSPYNGRTWVKSKSEDQYRRSLYTFWKRTAPYPSMLTFDGVSREICAPRRIRTNTPLQALVTMNDSVYLEAGRHLAFMMQDKSPDPENINQTISKGYELAMMKPIPAPKLEILAGLYNTAFRKLENDQESVCHLVGMDDQHSNPQTAALVVVAGALLNLDELITKN